MCKQKKTRQNMSRRPFNRHGRNRHGNMFMDDEIQSVKEYAPGNTDTTTAAYHFSRIYNKVDESGLSALVKQELRPDLDFLSEQFSLDDESLILLSAILERSGCRSNVSFEDLADFLGCSNIEFMTYHEKIKAMETAGLIRSSSGPCRNYLVTKELVKSLAKNTKFEPVKMSGLSAEEMFGRFDMMFAETYRGLMDEDDLIESIEKLMEHNSELDFCRRIKESELYSKDCDDEERKVFFALCTRFVCHGEDSLQVDRLLDIVSFMRFDMKREIANGENYLQKHGFVEYAINDGQVDEKSLALSDKAKGEFFNNVALATKQTIQHKDLIKASSIAEKKLFYNKAEKEQVDRLASLLDNENFFLVQERLKECGMRQGFNVIFYGGPGTGKTATVYELARSSGRDIFSIDMSQIRSKWVGDSEKNIKAVFRIYKEMCKTSKVKPILLFNEADAVFGKRIQVERSVDQMNNTIQNIILQEMEDLEGVLIATTNLENNLDEAFERRFIYKIAFNTPDADSRAKIWETMVPSLTGQEAGELANLYQFSGGNIENIARKFQVEYVLTGNRPTVESLKAFCEQEMLSRKKTARIGYQRSI